jgi:hypothetical protein
MAEFAPKCNVMGPGLKESVSVEANVSVEAIVGASKHEVESGPAMPLFRTHG